MKEQVEVGQRIRELRQAHGMTQEVAAERAKINPKYLGAIERGEINVTLATMVRLAKALGVSPSDFLIPGAGQPSGDEKSAVKRLVESLLDHAEPEKARRLRLFLEQVFR